jgi:hypothetical protein
VYPLVADAVGRALDELAVVESSALVDARYERLRRIGVFVESEA